MTDFLFYLFAVLTLLAAIKVSLSRDAVNAALSLIVCLIGVAALFVLLEAFFLAALQVLVYAGAVVVLFLFVIMLLDSDVTEDASKKRIRYASPITLSMSLIALFLLGTGIYLFFGPEGIYENIPHSTSEKQTAAVMSKNFGRELFTKYLLPFQVTGFLLLIAVVGVLILSKSRYSEK